MVLKTGSDRSDRWMVTIPVRYDQLTQKEVESKSNRLNRQFNRQTRQFNYLLLFFSTVKTKLFWCLSHLQPSTHPSCNVKSSSRPQLPFPSHPNTSCEPPPLRHHLPLRPVVVNFLPPTVTTLCVSPPSPLSLPLCPTHCKFPLASTSLWAMVMAERWNLFFMFHI